MRSWRTTAATSTPCRTRRSRCSRTRSRAGAASRDTRPATNRPPAWSSRWTRTACSSTASTAMWPPRCRPPTTRTAPACGRTWTATCARASTARRPAWTGATPRPCRCRRSWRTVPGDHQVTVEWDNLSELLQDQHLTNGANTRFIGYNIYRLDDWSRRRSDVPEPAKFQQIASFVRDVTLGGSPIAAVTDTTIDYARVLYERKAYPIGRYKFTDMRVQNG